jgi:hypothetical protein
MGVVFDEFQVVGSLQDLSAGKGNRPLGAERLQFIQDQVFRLIRGEFGFV